MTDDEINNKFDVVADLMASLAVKIDLLGDKVNGLADAQVRAEQRWERTEESIRSLLAIAEIHEREIEGLKETQIQTGKQMAETDGRLSALINTVERLISERRNGET